MGNAKTHQTWACDRLTSALGVRTSRDHWRFPYAEIMTEGAARLVARGQICLWLFLALCVALHPGFVLKRDESGLSNYGIHIKTAIPYSLALVLGGVYSFGGARLIRGSTRDSVITRAILRSYAALLVLNLLSTYPYKLSNPLNDFHVGVNVATAIFETVTAGWLACLVRAHPEMLIVFGIVVIGFSLGALTVANVFHLVFVAELLVGVGYGLLLYRSINLRALSSHVQ